MVTTVIVIAALLLGLPGLAVAVHLGLLALASSRYRDATPNSLKEVRFLVLVPAHNEESVIARCLESIHSDRRPDDHVLVVADRCSDATAKIARSYGSLVLERGPHEEPG